MTDHTHDIIIIGGGTAGLVTAAGAAALGAKAALVERARLGGECLWTACVPSKALISFARRYREPGAESRDLASEPSRLPPPGSRWEEASAWMRSAQARISPRDSPERFRSLGVDVVLSAARIAGPGAVETAGRTLSARRLVLAMGSRPAIPDVPGLAAAGFLTPSTALEQARLPRSVVILGGGPTGVEFAQTYCRLGVAVTLVEADSRVLPHEDREAAQLIERHLTNEGVAVRTAFRVREARSTDGVKVLVGSSGECIEADALFVATGRQANTDDAEVERAGVELTSDGAVRVDGLLRTTAARVWAAGDVTGGLAYTHVADYMARLVVRNALTPAKRRADYRFVPRVTSSDPELASVGLTEAEAHARGERVAVQRIELTDNDRAAIEGESVGFCKLVARSDGTLLGATIVGPAAGEMIMLVAFAMRHNVPLAAFAEAVFPYPTYGEMLKRGGVEWLRQRYGARARGRWLRRLVRWWGKSGL